MSTVRTNTLSNAVGSASVPVDTVISGSAKAWVNFNGTGTVAIRASFNVSSITDNGTGDYTVNFTTAMPDTSYSAVGGTEDISGSSNSQFLSFATTSVRVYTVRISPLALADNAIVTVSIFR